MGTISKNFSWSELEHSDEADKRGIINAVTTFKVRDSMLALVRNVLQPLRDEYGKPMKVNSGYRSETVNKLVGGVPTSQHVKGEAADIHTGNEQESYKLASIAKQMKLPYDQMILYPTFVHFSHRLTGKQRRAILYNYRYKGEKLDD